MTALAKFESAEATTIWTKNKQTGQSIFNGTQFDAWWKRNTPYLRSFEKGGNTHNLLPYFDITRYPLHTPFDTVSLGGVDEDGNTIPTRNQTQVDFFVKLNDWALTFLLNHVTDTLSLSIDGCTRAAQAYEVLKSNHDPVDHIKINNYMTDAFSLQLTECESVEEWITRIDTATRQLAATGLGIEISGTTLAYYLLHRISVLPEYQSVFDSFMITRPHSAGTLQFNEVKQALITKSANLKHIAKEQANSAAARGMAPPSSTNGNTNKSTCHKCKREGKPHNHAGDTCYWVVPCDVCGELGHKSWMKKCPKNKRHNQSSGSSESSNSAQVNKDVNPVPFYPDVHLLSLIQKPVEWDQQPSVIINDAKLICSFHKVAGQRRQPHLNIRTNLNTLRKTMKLNKPITLLTSILTMLWYIFSAWWWIIKCSGYTFYTALQPGLKTVIWSFYYWLEITFGWIWSLLHIQLHSAMATITERPINPEHFMVDSGCSRHLCADKSLFTKLRQLGMTEHVTITVANGDKIYATGIGNVLLRVKTSTQHDHQILIRNVYYVPKLSNSLLSVSQLTDNGIAITFQPYKEPIFSRDGHVIGTGFRQKNLYYLNAVKPSQQEFAAYAASDDAANLWHARLCHTGQYALDALRRTGLFTTSSPKHKDCVSCALGKSKRHSVPKLNLHPPTEILEVVHVDTWSCNTATRGGHRYLVMFTCGKSGYTSGFLQRTKSGPETLKNFQTYKNAMEKWTGKTIKTVHSDCGTEFLNSEFETFCQEHGITRTTSTPYIHEQNGIAERKNRTIFGLTLTMLIASTCHLSLWGEACMTAIYVFNRIPTAKNNWKSAYEIFTGRTPALDHLRVWGCMVTVHQYDNIKMRPKARVGRFVGYDAHAKAYRILLDGQILLSRDVTFFEHIFSTNDLLNDAENPDDDDFEWFDSGTTNDPPALASDTTTDEYSSDSDTDSDAASDAATNPLSPPPTPPPAPGRPQARLIDRIFQAPPIRQPVFTDHCSSSSRPQRQAAANTRAKITFQLNPKLFEQQQRERALQEERDRNMQQPPNETEAPDLSNTSSDDIDHLEQAQMACFVSAAVTASPDILTYLSSHGLRSS
jgi:hypothetical protein